MLEDYEYEVLKYFKRATIIDEVVGSHERHLIDRFVSLGDLRLGIHPNGDRETARLTEDGLEDVRLHEITLSSFSRWYNRLCNSFY